MLHKSGKLGQLSFHFMFRISFLKKYMICVLCKLGKHIVNSDDRVSLELHKHSLLKVWYVNVIRAALLFFNS